MTFHRHHRQLLSCRRPHQKFHSVRESRKMVRRYRTGNIRNLEKHLGGELCTGVGQLPFPPLQWPRILGRELTTWVRGWAMILMPEQLNSSSPYTRSHPNGRSWTVSRRRYFHSACVITVWKSNYLRIVFIILI